jgi:hypothetical protein
MSLGDIIHQKNSNCYSFKEVKYDAGMFDSSVDMAYVMTMPSSKRDYMAQLDKYKPLHTVKIQTNQGFRTCEKVLFDYNTWQDINDSLRSVFVDALNNKYETIIVFEDDFEFDANNQFMSEDIKNINKFLSDRSTYDVYNIGSLISVRKPLQEPKNHVETYTFCPSHSVIYTSKYMLEYIKDYTTGKINTSCDTYWSKSKIRLFAYYKPICFQYFPSTENQKEWLNYPIATLLNICSLDKSTCNYVMVYNIIDKAIIYTAIMVFLILLILLLITIVVLAKK